MRPKSKNSTSTPRRSGLFHNDRRIRTAATPAAPASASSPAPHHTCGSMVPLRETPMTALSAGPRVKGELIVAMLLGPASCAEPQTPPATPAADRPRRPAPPDRPAMSANGAASAEGVSVVTALSAEPPAAGATDPAVPVAVFPGAVP